jgi:fucose 4-O-acetylase-like acetyltransferase
MIVLICVYILGAALTYTYLMGKTADKNNKNTFKKVIFSILWPIHAICAYSRMVANWEDPKDE